MKVVRITALWCMSCLVMKSRYNRLFKTYNIEDVVDLDFDLDNVKAYKPGQILPVVIIYKDDKEIHRIVGEKSKKQLIKIFESLPKN